MQDGQSGLLPEIKGGGYMPKVLSPFTWTHIRLPQVDLSRVNEKKNKGKKQNQTVYQKPKTKEKQKKSNVTISGNQKVRKKKSKQKSRYETLQPIEEKQKEKAKKKQEKIKLLDKSMDIQRKKIKKIKEQRLNRSIDLEPEKKGIVEKHMRKLNQTIMRQETKVSQSRNVNTIKFGRLRSPGLNSHCTSVTACTFSFNKIQPYLHRSLVNSGWSESRTNLSDSYPELIWTDNYYNNKLLPGQLHNHIKNGYLLTSKNNLHQSQSASGSLHYPISFLLPQQYELFCFENEQNYIKIVLKLIVNDGVKQGLIKIEEKADLCLGTILPDLTKSNSLGEENIIGLRLCLYLQNYRKVKSYKYFESYQNYVNVQIQLKDSVRASILKFCFNYIENINNKDQNNFHSQNMRSDLLQLMWYYHCMLIKYEQSYVHNNQRNMWIVKPIASSRGAGIFIFPNSLEFTTIFSHHQFSNKSKYANKIVQKYVENPLLLSQPQKFAGRKFDIRQWVLLTSQNGSPVIYLYEEGYCRFSDIAFGYSHKKKDETRVHLTNYSKSDKSNKQNSIMMLSEVFEHSKQIKQKISQNYEEQITKIVVESILNTPQIKYEPGHFQLLGYDLILDQNLYLWLLEVNLNPACESTRNKNLQKQANAMVQSMMFTVKKLNKAEIGNKPTKWKKIYGEVQKQLSQFSDNEVVDAKIKPYYEVRLEGDSLIEQVRKRNKMQKMIEKVACIINLWQPWNRIKEHEAEKPQEDGDSEQGELREEEKGETEKEKQDEK